MTITLRPYQQDAIEAVIADWDTGLTDVLVTMATGLGKTAVFLSLLDRALTDSKRGLVIAHRKELIDQPLARLIAYYPRWAGSAGIVMADTDEPQKQLIVATIQTLASSPKRLAKILAYGPIDYLVIDECHHVTDKNTYRKVLEILREANPALRHMGVTATPIRADGDGLGGVYQKESYHYGIIEGIKIGALSPVRWLAIQTSISVAGIKTVAGDFQQRGLSNVFETANCFDLVVETHKRYAAERQAAAFTVTVEGAYRLAEAFRAGGVSAAAADGTTDKRSRARILRDFQEGRTQVLCNVGLYTEGLDVPQISCIHQVRPTKSDGLYTQIIGRALRTYPGKEDALILDYAPAETRNIAMMGDVLGVPLRKESYVKQDAAEGEAAGGFTFDGAFRYLEGSAAEIISRQLDYLNISPWSWWRQDGWLSLGLGEASDNVERVLLISPPRDDGDLVLYGIARRITHYDERKQTGQWTARELGRGSFGELSELADGVCGRYGNHTLAQKTKSWRRQPPTDAQISFARRLQGAWKPGYTKGELAQAITHAQAVKAVNYQMEMI